MIRLGLLREDLDYHLMRASPVVLFAFSASPFARVAASQPLSMLSPTRRSALPR